MNTTIRSSSSRNDHSPTRFNVVVGLWLSRRKARRYYEWGRAIEIATRGSAEGPRAARLFSRGLRALRMVAPQDTLGDTLGDASTDRQRLETALSRSAPWQRLSSWSSRRRTLVAVAAFAVAAAFLVLSLGNSPKNIALNHPWKSSSTDAGFPATGQVADASVPMAFMHTLEEDEPWVSVNLEGLRRITRVEVINRHDCCGDRALPLVVEASLNGETWDPIARRAGPFTVWRASVVPRMTRFVRFRLDRKGILHLAGIRLFG